MATLLGTEGYGELGYLLAIAGTAGSFASLGSSNTLIVFRAKEIPIQATLYFLVLIASAITSIILYFIIDNIIVSIYPIAFVIFSLSIYELLGRKFYKTYSKLMIFQRVLMVVLSLSFYYIIGIDGIVLGYVVSYFCFVVPLYKGFKQTKIDFSLIRNRLSFVGNNYVIDIVKTAAASIDKLIIFPIFGAILLGNYHLGFQIFGLLMLIPVIVFQYVLPHDASGNRNIKLKKYTIVISVILMISSILLAPHILPIIFEDFTDTVIIIQIMSLALIPATINLMYNSEFLGKEMSKIVLIGASISVGTLSMGIIILGDLFGIIGIASSLVISRYSELIFLQYSKSKLLS